MRALSQLKRGRGYDILVRLINDLGALANVIKAVAKAYSGKTSSLSVSRFSAWMTCPR